MSPWHGLLAGLCGSSGWPVRLALTGPWSLHVWPRLCGLGAVDVSLGWTLVVLGSCMCGLGSLLYGPGQRGLNISLHGLG